MSMAISRKIGATLAALALLALAPAQAAGPASANARANDHDYAGQVHRYLTDQATKITGEGFRPDPAVPDLVRPLRLDGGLIWPIALHAGVTYRVFAVCDNDCSDVDLELYDSSG